MLTVKTPIYLASVLLEKNRWSSRTPSFKVSDWMPRIAEAGFDGIELWENHLLKADVAEREAVRNGPLSVAILNTYCNFDNDGAEARAASAEMARFLNVSGIKFNFGNDKAQERTYIKNLQVWRDELPTGCRLLCECHPGTILEDPDNAVKILAPLRGEVEIIVHAFGNDDGRGLRNWLETFGSAVTHVHAVLKNKQEAPERIALLQEYGFSGTWTIEFCEGVWKGAEMDQLLATAAEDMKYLRKAITGSFA